MNSCKRSNIQLTQKTGQSMKEVMSQKAVTDLIDNTVNDYTLKIKDEADIRKQADDNITNNLNLEIQNRELSEEQINQTISDNYNELNDAISTETTNRQKGDENLQKNIDNVDKKFADYPKLDSGIIPSQYLPSYVDDVLEYSTLTAFPRTGETGKIYVTLDTNLTYRWTGSDYIEISKSLGLGETSSTAYPGNKGNELAVKLADIESGAQKNKNSLEYLQTAVGSNNTSVPLKDKTNLILKTSEDSGILLIPNTTYAQVEFSLTEDYKKNKANGIPSLDNTGKIPIGQLPDSIVNNNPSVTPAFTQVIADQGNFTATSTNTSFKIAGGTGIKTSLSGTNTIEVSLTEEYTKGANNGIAELVDGRIPANRMPEGFDPGGSNLQIGTTTGTAFDGGKGAELERKLETIDEGAQKNRNQISSITTRSSGSDSGITSSIADTSILNLISGDGISLSCRNSSSSVTDITISSYYSYSTLTLRGENITTNNQTITAQKGLVSFGFKDSSDILVNYDGADKLVNFTISENFKSQVPILDKNNKLDLKYLPDTAIFVDIRSNGSTIAADLFTSNISSDLINGTQENSKLIFDSIDDILSGKKQVYLKNMDREIYQCSVLKRGSSNIHLYVSKFDYATSKQTVLMINIHDGSTNPGKYASINKMTFTADS